MNSNDAEPAVRRAPLPSLSSSSSFQIRAPLSFGSSSGSEIELDSDAGSGSGSESEPDSAPDEAVPVPVPTPVPALDRLGSMPVARLTNDDETEEEEEEVFDDVDGDGFVVRVPVPALDEDGSPSPNFSSEDEVFDEVDGDGFSTTARVSSQGGSSFATSPNPSLAVDDGDEAKLSEVPELESPKEVADGVFGENEGFESEADGGGDNGDRGDELNEQDGILGGGFEETSSTVEESEDLKSMEVGSDVIEIEKGVADEVFQSKEAELNAVQAEEIGDQNPILEESLDKARVWGNSPNVAEYSESSEEEVFDEVDGDGFRVSSQDGSASVSPRPSLVADVVLVESEESSIADGVLGGSPNLNESNESESGGSGDNGDGDYEPNDKDEILDGGFEETSSIVEDSEGSKPMETESDKIKMEKGGADKGFIEGEVEYSVVQAVDAVLAPNSEENDGEDGLLDKDLNPESPIKDGILSEDLRIDEADGNNVSDSMDGTDEENDKDIDALDEKDEMLGSGLEQTNTIDDREPTSKLMEVKSPIVEIEMHDIEEDSKHKELESRADESNKFDFFPTDYDQNNKLDDKDASVVVEFGNSESSTSGNDSEANETVSRVSSSLVGSDIGENDADNLDDVHETHTSVVDDEKAANKIGQSSIQTKAKPIESDHEFTGDVDFFGAEQIAMKRDYQHSVSEEIVRDEEEGRDILNSDTLLELLRAATTSYSSNGNNTITASDSTRILPANSPAGLGYSHQPLEQNISTTSNLAVASKPEKAFTLKEKKFHEKVELIRVKFLRIIHRLGRSPSDNLAASVLYHLVGIEDMKYGMLNLEDARNKAIELEREDKHELDFSCNILVIGKSGVGKSATINSIFEEEKSLTNPFKSETTSVRKIEGFVDGIKIRVLDTPGLKPSLLDQASNRKILSSVKKHMKKCPPDIVLYMDRLDTETRDFNDLPLLRLITSTLGSLIWSGAIVVLSHAATDPPEGPSGSALSYESYVDQRSLVVQQSIRQAAGDVRLMNPVVLVENHPACRRNREGQKVLPNGSRWRSELLLLCCSSKILSESNSLSEVQESSVQKLFKSRLRSPPLHFFLSSLLESKPHPKLSSGRGGNDDLDIDLDEFSDQEDEEGEYDQLPPFHPLTKSQIAKLTKEQKRGYFDEHDYRVKLLQKKQWKEEIRRLKEIKKRGVYGQPEPIYGDLPEDFDDSSAPIVAPLPDMVLPPSFDCDSPAYRYRSLEPNPQFLTGLFMVNHCWDHDYGYDGVSLQKLLAIAARFPAAISVKLKKDKEDFTIHLDSSVSAKHGERGSSLASFEVQTIGSQLAYILMLETKFRNMKKNKSSAGVSTTFLGDNVATGLKLQDQVLIGKRINLAISTGAVQAQGDKAYGANLEATLMKKDYPPGRALATLGLSLVRYHGNLAYGGSLQSELSFGRNSKTAIHVGLNNKKTGQITIKTSISEQHQISLMGLISIAIFIFRRIWPGKSSSEERDVLQIP